MIYDTSRHHNQSTGPTQQHHPLFSFVKSTTSEGRETPQCTAAATTISASTTAHSGNKPDHAVNMAKRRCRDLGRTMNCITRECGIRSFENIGRRTYCSSEKSHMALGVAGGVSNYICTTPLDIPQGEGHLRESGWRSSSGYGTSRRAECGVPREVKVLDEMS